MRSTLGIDSNVMITVRDKSSGKSLSTHYFNNMLTREFMVGLTQYLSGNYVVLDSTSNQSDLQYMHSSITYLPRYIIAGSSQLDSATSKYDGYTRVSELSCIDDLSKVKESDTSLSVSYNSVNSYDDPANEYTRITTYQFYLSRESSTPVTVESLAMVSNSFSSTEDQVTKILALLDTHQEDESKKIKLSSDKVLDVVWSIILTSVPGDSTSSAT